MLAGVTFARFENSAFYTGIVAFAMIAFVAAFATARFAALKK